MLTEGFLAVLVIIACGAGLGLGVLTSEGQLLHGEAAWLHRYGSWQAVGALAAKVGAFVDGSSNLLAAARIPRDVSVALMGVLVASFAATTLDTACRLQRYVVQELAGALSPARQGSVAATALAPLRNMHGATLLAVGVAAFLAAVPPVGEPWSFAAAGKGGMLLWPLFGATNQLLAGLAFLVIAFYLWRRRMPLWFVVLPMVFMLAMPMWAMLLQVFSGDDGSPGWLARREWVLLGIGLGTIALEVWMVLEALLLFPRVRGVLEPASTVTRVTPETDPAL